MPDSIRRMVLGATLLILISIYSRQRGLRQNKFFSPLLVTLQKMKAEFGEQNTGSRETGVSIFMYAAK